MTEIEVKDTPTHGSAVHTQPARATLVPRFSVDDSEGGIALRIELPGARLEDVELSVEDRVLSLKALRPARSRQGYRVLGAEYFDGEASYERSFVLPDDIDPEGVSAELRDGVLTTTLRRAVPERREIRVHGT